MIKITITSDKTHTPPGTSPKTGKPYTFRLQTGYLHEVDDEGVVSEIPAKFEFFVPDNRAPYARGNYTLADSAVRLDYNGKLETRMNLVPVPAAASK